MKINFLILLSILSIVILSCDDGLKFDNPNDRNSDAYNPSDTEGETDSDSDETDTISENDDENDNPSETDNDEPISDDADSIDDSGDSKPDESDSDDDSADSVPDDDSDSTDTTPDESDSTPDEDADTDSGDSTPDQDTDTDTAPTTPCDPNPCDSVTNSTGSCTINDTTYICGCNDGYFWNGSECHEQITLGNICTGQTKCYNNTEEITCPTSETADFYGQDAQYAKAGYCYPQSFSIKTNASGENIVVDNNTGLEWQQVISEETFTWENATTHCEGLNYGGHKDWRLPTPQELLTIANSNRHDPPLDSTYFQISLDLWTSKPYSQDEQVAFSFGASYGYVWWYKNKSTAMETMCVRGNELPEPVFSSSKISGDTIIYDSTTGLIWQQTYETSKTWQEAIKYCEDLTYAGKNDWRLPNKNELASLLDYDKSSSPYSDFPNMPKKWFWSSTTSNESNKIPIAWHTNFGNTDKIYGTNTESKSGSTSTSSNAVRCVRSEKINDPCNPNPCNGLANSTQTCTQHNAFEYSCGCNSGYFWNGQKCAVLPECSATSGTPCKDSTSLLIWSTKTANTNDKTWEQAVVYCQNLNEGGFFDWHLPTIDELRTLITNCPGTETNGACAISEKNGKLSGNDSSDDCSCAYKSGSYYSKIGDDHTVSPWSSSTRSDDPERAWFVGFFAGVVSNSDKTTVTSDVRCVR